MVNLADLAEQLLDEASRAGADAADSIAVKDHSLQVDVLNGALEQGERSEGADAGLRVFVGNRQACVSGTDMRKSALAEMAMRAVAMAKEAPEDRYAGLADADQLAVQISLAPLEMQDPTSAPSPTECERMALETETAALAVQGVSKVDTAAAGCGEYAVHLAATNGFSNGYRRTYRFIACSAIAGDSLKMESDYRSEMRVFASDLPSPSEIGTTAGERAVSRVRPSRPRTGAFPVIFDERVAASLVGHLLSAANGTAVARGSSWLESLGSKVLPECIDLVEEPQRPRSMASRPFDAEGLPSVKRSIVSQGNLKTWILDLATARKLEMESTGNASRSTSAPPSPSVSNVSLTQGDRSKIDLMREMGTGLLVDSLIGLTINPTTGDYSRGASGFWVEGGEIVGPVSELTIAGNLKQILKSIVPANDARPFANFRVPSLLAEGLVIAGE